MRDFMLNNPDTYLFLFLHHDGILFDLDHEFLGLVGRLHELWLQVPQVLLHHGHLPRREVQLFQTRLVSGGMNLKVKSCSPEKYGRYTFLPAGNVIIFSFRSFLFFFLYIFK